ncbi:MAG: hypothetical protein OS130_15135 [Thermodesulfobacteriota bacterium]|jgi:hypothetical protein|nr:MAG: hypothetical protein OS130_15135 [Thermodesulfobacteriota bacterium]
MDSKEVFYYHHMTKTETIEMPPKSDRLKGVEFGVEKELITMFLKMTPKERLRSNENTVRAIMELRNAYKKRESVKLSD